MPGTESGRLECWVQIADYLKCNVRTARRWEKRGLPVHRLPGGERSGVYAYQNEIDAWISGARGGASNLGLSSQGDPPDRSAQEISATRAGLEAATKTEPEKVATPEDHVKRNARFQKLSSIARLKFGTSAAIFLISAGVLAVVFLWLFRLMPAFVTAGASDPIEIRSVSPISARGDQTIVIQGRGFGMHTAYKNADSPYIAIRNNTVRWAAGRMIPQNWDEITLNIESWEDTKIVVSGFSGAYGLGEWKLNAGDEMEVAVWNPQSGRGPALYHLSVSRIPLN